MSKIVFYELAWEQYLYWQTQDKKFIKKLNKLLADIDRNGNGKWDTGNYGLGLQPEEVFYQPEAIPVKAMWEVEQKTPWSLRALPLTEQKPRALVKAKAEKQRDLKERNRQREEELGQQKKR